MTKKKGIPVSARALIQRINRKFLKEDGPPAREVKKTRGGRAEIDFGDYYILNTEVPSVDDHHVDIEELGRKLGVLQEWEYLDEGGSR